EAFTKGVIPEQGEALIEAPFDFYNSALVKSVSRRGVLVVLHNQRIHKAEIGIGRTGKAARLSAAQRVSGRARIPVAIGNRLAFGQSYGADRRRQQICVDCNREPLGMSVD